MFQPLFLTDLLAGLGFGQRVMVIASMILAVLYLLKSRRAAGTVVSTMGTLWLASVSIFVAAAAALALGWVSPDTSAFFDDVVKAGEFAYDVVRGPLDDWVRRLFGRVL